MNRQTASQPAQGRSGRPRIDARKVNTPAEGDDTRWREALAAFDEAQRLFDLVHQSSRVSDRERARAYQCRAEAFTMLAQLAPMDTPMPFIRGLFVAASADAEIAREYERRAARAGDSR